MALGAMQADPKLRVKIVPVRLAFFLFPFFSLAVSTKSALILPRYLNIHSLRLDSPTSRLTSSGLEPSLNSEHPSTFLSSSSPSLEREGRRSELLVVNFSRSSTRDSRL